MFKPPSWDVGTVCLMTDHLQSPEISDMLSSLIIKQKPTPGEEEGLWSTD